MMPIKTVADYAREWRAVIELEYKKLEKANSYERRIKIKRRIFRYERKLRALNKEPQMSYEDWKMELIKLIIEEKLFTKQSLRFLAVKSVINNYYEKDFTSDKTPEATWRKSLSLLKEECTL
jgi:hypothetical protein